MTANVPAIILGIKNLRPVWCKGSSRMILSSFSQEYTEYAGGGVNGRRTLFKHVDYSIFIRDRLKSTFSKYYFGRDGGRGGGVNKKEYSSCVRF